MDFLLEIAEQGSEEQQPLVAEALCSSSAEKGALVKVKHPILGQQSPLVLGSTHSRSIH